MNRFLFFIGILLSCSCALAQEDSNVGNIDYVNPEYLDLVIDDSVYTFALNVKVFDAKGREANRYALRPGSKVKFEFTRSPNGDNQLSHVWLISETNK